MTKNLFIACLLAMQALSIGMQAENTITIGSASGAPGSTVTVTLSLRNTDAVSALQVKIPMPDDCSLVEGSAKAGARAASHSVTAGVRNDTLNLIAYSAAMQPLTGTDGEVMSFQLLLGNQPGTISLDVSKIIATDASGNKVDCNGEDGTVIVSAAKAEYSSRSIDFGRVPIRSTYNQNLTISNTGNTDLTVTAFDFSVPELTSSTSLPFTVPAGDSRTIDIQYAPTLRGEVNASLRVVCNSSSKLNTIAIKACPYAVNELHVADASGVADSTVTINLSMNNMDAVSAFQFEFALPRQLKFIDGSFALSERKDDHQAVATLSGDTLRLIAFSIDNKPFKGNDGTIATFKVRLSGQYNTALEPYKALLIADVNGKTENVLSDEFGGYISIESPILSAERNLDMGSTPVTKDAEGSLKIYNYGSAPLTISRVEFDTLQFSIKEQLPLTVGQYETKLIHVVYKGQAQEPYKAIMQLYCNDPDNRVWKVNVAGSRFAPNYLAMNAPGISIGDTLKVDVALDNYDAINGIQFDVDFPHEYFSPMEEVIPTSRANGLSVQVRKLENNTYRYFVYSLSDASIQPDSGSVFTFLLSPTQNIPVGDYELKVSNIKLGTPELADKYSGNDFNVAFHVNLKEQDIIWLHKDTTILVGDSCVADAKSSTSLPISYKVIAGEELVKTTSENGKLKLKALKSGLVKIVASAEADATHGVATDTCTVTINKLTQTITWNQDSSLYVGSTLKLTATASSDSLVIYEITSGSEFAELVFDKEGVTLKALKPGIVTVTARQAGNDKFEAAELSKKFTVLELDGQTITWIQQTASLNVGDSCVFKAVSSASLPVTYTVTKGSELVETYVYEGVLHVIALKAGDVSITASAEGDSTHEEATSTLDMTIKVATSIKDISVNATDGNWYTLQGIKLNGEPKEPGVYIHNGKRILLRR